MKTETELIRSRIHAPLERRWPDMYLPKIVGGPYNRGLPDKLGCIDGVAVAIEAKKQGGKLTRIQEENLKQMAKAGGVALCVTMRNDRTVQIVDYTEPWANLSNTQGPSPASLLSHTILALLGCKDVTYVVPLYLTPVTAGPVTPSSNKKKP